MCEVAVLMYFKIPLWQRPGLWQTLYKILSDRSWYSIWDSNTVPLPFGASGI